VALPAGRLSFRASSVLEELDDEHTNQNPDGELRPSHTAPRQCHQGDAGHRPREHRPTPVHLVHVLAPLADPQRAVHRAVGSSVLDTPLTAVFSIK
jgi:hypothetical protein